MAAVSSGTNGALAQALLASVAPNYQTQELEAQRRLQLADALRQQALTDTPGNGGKISWTQGLARLAAALSSSANARAGYKEMTAANQGLGASTMGGIGHYAPGVQQIGQGAPPAPPGASPPQMPPQAAPAPSGGPPQAGSVDPLAPLPDNAPPQAAPPPPPANAAQPQQAGGAPQWVPGPMALSGTPNDAAMMFMNPDEYGKAVIGNAAKGTAPTDGEILMNHARQAFANGDQATGMVLAQQAYKLGYIEPINVRQGGAILDPVTKKPVFVNPQMDKGIVAKFGPDGMPVSAQALPGYAKANAGIEATEKGAVANVQSHYGLTQRFNPETGQMESVPVSGVLNNYFGKGQGTATSPSLGQQSAFEQYGKHSADAFAETQGIANSSPQRVQSLREMQALVAQGMPTGPSRAKLQQVAEEHGLSFLANDNAFVFNKDAARFVAQSAADLGLNGSDARLGMMANASPNLKMTPQALKTVIPTMIGLEYAKMAKATAASTWAQRNPGTNAQFESEWRKNYDPQMFTAYAQGGPKALASAPANVKAKWLQDYRALKSMGVDFGAFAQ